MTVFEFDDYRDFLGTFLRQQPRRGFGGAARLSRLAEVHPSTIVRVLGKEKDLTPEQGLRVALVCKLSRLELDFFLACLQRNRASGRELYDYYTQQMNQFRLQSQTPKERLSPAPEFDDLAKARFYSEWYYSAIRLATSIPWLQTSHDISQRLKLPLSTVDEALQFLVKFGLVEEKSGRYLIGHTHTHLDSKHPLIHRHHANFRLRATETAVAQVESNLRFTSPVSISKKDVLVVRAVLLETIEKVFQIVEPSQPEELQCISIDWFQV